MPHDHYDAAITFVYAPKWDESIVFYEQKLRLPLVVDQGSCRIYRVSANGYFGICDRPREHPPTGVILTLVVDDVEGRAAALEGRGVALDGDGVAHSEVYHITHAFFRDPNGYLLEIQRFDDPEWHAVCL